MPSLPGRRRNLPENARSHGERCWIRPSGACSYSQRGTRRKKSHVLVFRVIHNVTRLGISLWIGPRTSDDAELSTPIHNVSTGNPQGCPQFRPQHGVERAGGLWTCVWTVDNLGTTRPKSVDRTVDNLAEMWIVPCWHSSIHRSAELSTDPSPGCPHPDRGNELGKRGLSTLSTALTTTTTLVLLLRRKEEKQARLEVGDNSLRTRLREAWGPVSRTPGPR